MLSETPLSAGLSKRLSEAADGFRDGLYHYFIASRTSPYFIVTPPGSSSDESARSAAFTELEFSRNEKPERDYEIFGPYFTPAEMDAADYDFIEIRMMRNTQYKGTELVRSFTLEADADAIFLNLSAVDKFVVPYYARVYSGEKAQQMRNASKTEFMAAKAPTIHKGGTVYVSTNGTSFDH